MLKLGSRVEFKAMELSGASLITHSPKNAEILQKLKCTDLTEKGKNEIEKFRKKLELEVKQELAGREANFKTYKQVLRELKGKYSKYVEEFPVTQKKQKTEPFDPLTVDLWNKMSMGADSEYIIDNPASSI